MSGLIGKINIISKILIFTFINFLLFIPKCYSEEHKEVKVGILLGFTGAVETLTPQMAESAELAFNEITKNEDAVKDISFKLLRADTACNNINFAKNSASKLVKDGVDSIIGAACPGITKEVAKEISIPKKILMISPADNSNELITLKDDDYIFRTTPSKIRGSQILADITSDRGIKKIAISYSIENDYKIFAEAFSDALNKKNVKTSIMLPHNRNVNDYSKHISALSAAGGDALAIISDVNLGGDQIIKSVLDTGMFNIFILSETMVDQKIINNFKEKDLQRSFGYVSGLSNLGSDKFIDIAQKSGIDPFSPYTNESYDAAAVIILSNFAKFYSKNMSYKEAINFIANKPGTKIYPGEINKAINILREGKIINYEGATGIEFDNFGDTLGSFLEVDFKKGKIKTKKIR